jgi:hypothetical protein
MIKEPEEVIYPDLAAETDKVKGLGGEWSVVSSTSQESGVRSQVGLSSFVSFLGSFLGALSSSPYESKFIIAFEKRTDPRKGAKQQEKN